MSNGSGSPKRKKPSLYALTVLSTTLVLCLSFGSVITFTVLQQLRHDRDLAEARLSASAGRVSGVFVADVAPVRSFLDLSSEIPVVTEAQLTEEGHPAAPLLIRFLQSNSAAASVSIALSNGQLYRVARSADQAAPEGTALVAESVRQAGATGSPTQEPWYEAAAVAGATVRIVTEDPATGEPTVLFARRFGSEPFGVVAVRLSFDRILSADAELAAAAFMDSAGGLIAGAGELSALLAQKYREGDLSVGRASQIVHDSELYLALVHPVDGPEAGSGDLVVLADRLPSLLRNVALIRNAGILAAIAIFGIGFAAFLLARSVRGVRQLVGSAESLGRLQFDVLAPPAPRARELAQLHGHLESMRTVLKGATRYLSRSLVQQMIDEGTEPEIGGTWRPISVMFTAIRGFTTISEGNNAGLMFLQLSEYFRLVGRAIRDSHGVINKFIGDAIMALWNATEDTEKHARNAMLSALAIRHLMITINELWEENDQPRLESRIGLHTGSALVGNIGNAERLDFTAMGSTVNLAARLEGMNKYFDTDILVSKDILEAAGRGFVSRQIGLVRPKGSSENMEIYELVGAGWEAPECPVIADADAQMKATNWNKILPLFYARKWREAIEAIDGFLADHPNDRIAAVYRDLSTKYLRREPGKDWHGVLSMR